MIMINKNLAEIKRKLDAMFTPDIKIKWDEAFKGYIITPTNDTGKIWLKRHTALRLDTNNSKFITASELDAVINSMGKCGLCYEIEDKEEKDE